jgi:exodeoxyribonuclease-5
VARGTLLAGQVRQFTNLLERLRQEDAGPVQQAIATLSRWCQDTRLTERGGPLSPIQLLSPEDAVGQDFDAVWVMNVHDGNWPGAAASNPFVPPDLVRHIPRATPEGELNFTRQVQRQLDLLAPEVHYSWSRAGDDVPRLASPLLAAAAVAAAGAQPLPHWPVLMQAAGAAVAYPGGYAGHPWLQALDDSQGLPLQAEEGARMPGGSAMVRSQSACPLMAYLLYRLQLRFEPMPGPFADYAYRGKLLHEALHQLFREHVGQPGLPSGDGIAAAVERAMQRHQAQQRLAPAALRAEQQRLQRVLQQWLVFERPRQGFVVAALEQEHRVVAQGLVLDFRLDRIDRLDDGRQLIIDYKSGAVDVGGWLRQRLGEPQLPLYAVLLDLQQPGSVGGLALASVRAGDCRLAGVVDDPQAAWQTLYASDNRRSAFGRAFAGWEHLLEHWKTGIGVLLQEIAAGHAANCLYEEEGLRYAGLDSVLRRGEGEAWLLAHGAGLAADHDA